MIEISQMVSIVERINLKETLIEEAVGSVSVPPNVVRVSYYVDRLYNLSLGYIRLKPCENMPSSQLFGFFSG
jgi:hypothetical protein